MAYCVSGNYSISGCLSVGVDLTGNGSNNRIWSKAGNQETYNPATYAGNYAQILIQPLTSCVNDTALIRYARPDGGVEAVFGFVQTQLGDATADFVIQGSSCGYSEKFRIAGNNVGIGTCSPISKLHIQDGQIRVQGAPSDSITGTMGFYLANTGNTEAYNWQMSCNFNLGLWTFSNTAGGGWGLRGPVITQSGNVGIGCATPRNTLEIVGGTSSPALCATNCDVMKIAGISNSSLSIGSTVVAPYSMWMQVKHQTSDNLTYPLSLQTCGGNVGIGILNPGSYKLYVNGSFYSAGSSCEYKTQICNYNTDSCMFMKLKPVTYQYKDEYCHLGKELKSGTQIGLIAEDTAEVFPELAILKEEENEKVVRNVDYEKLSIILLSEVQKLRREVDDLKHK